MKRVEARDTVRITEGYHAFAVGTSGDGPKRIGAMVDFAVSVLVIVEPEYPRRQGGNNL
ncbi:MULTISPECIES: hypothetical protein [Paenibacillus]|uniref:hypothetical protein n=1 Tax=Paenibacillus TaxID=44249 RepID=UPI0015C39FEB|nr:hypothetical protein [Paenibacillus odorifer]